MSLAVEEAPALVTKPLTTEQRMEIFKDAHMSGVRKDFNDALHHAKNGRFVVVVTPNRVAVRLSNSSSVRVDMAGAGCESYMWLRSLYRANCVEGTRVEFGYRKALNATCGDHLEDIFMLEVRIFIIGHPKKKRVSRKK